MSILIKGHVPLSILGVKGHEITKLTVLIMTSSRDKSKFHHCVFSAAQDEVTKLQEQLTALGECATRVSELEYHNKALKMISKQQLPQIEEKAKQALANLKAATVGEWNFY